MTITLPQGCARRLDSLPLSRLLPLGEFRLVNACRGATVTFIYLHIVGFGAILLSGFCSVASEAFDPRKAALRFAHIAAGSVSAANPITKRLSGLRPRADSCFAPRTCSSRRSPELTLIALECTVKTVIDFGCHRFSDNLSTGIPDPD